MFVDTHAHIFLPNFDGEVDTIINNAVENGVDYIIVPATDIETSKQVIELTKKYDMVYGAVGVHPHDSKDWSDDWITQIEELAKHEKIVAIGEIGLDYFYDFSPKEKQIQAFKAQIELALKLDLPVVIHNRDSDEDMLDIIHSYSGSGLKAQFHCFNGSLDDSRELIKKHHLISFTGNITFKKADELRDIVSKTSLENIMIETDSPFMTPVPFRGKRNEPAYVKLVAQQIADIHKISVEDVGRITSYNAFKFFGVGSKPKTSFTYKLKNNLYINITNRCNADCVFCDRKGEAVLHGYNLKMTKADEPPAEVYINEIGDPKNYDEIVFCGYGEPTTRWDVVKQVAKFVKANGGKTRLDTNGHGSFINKRDITPEMKNLIDTVSISLNATSAHQYADIMRLEPRMFNEMINFAKNVKAYVDKVVMSVVSIEGMDTDKARDIVENKVGAEFRVRPYF